MDLNKLSNQLHGIKQVKDSVSPLKLKKKGPKWELVNRKSGRIMGCSAGILSPITPFLEKLQNNDSETPET